MLDVDAFLARPLETRSDFEAVLSAFTGADWEAIGRRALELGLLAARESPFHRERVTTTAADISRDPFRAVLGFPSLTKEDYWHHAVDLRLPAYASEHTLTFHTSGTELGVPLEQPWDDWSYRRGFMESSALALVRGGCPLGGGVLITNAVWGALARTFIWACERLGAQAQVDPSSVGDPAQIDRVADLLRNKQLHTITAPPGVLEVLLRELDRRAVDVAAAKVSCIISGIGNFLTPQHVEMVVERFRPQVVLEQGGKNEVLHAPGGVRYRAAARDQVCVEGYLHYLPHASYVTAVDAEAFSQGRLEELDDGEQGVLLMTRLASGRSGIVAYVNDCGDLGAVRRAATRSELLCPCGNPMPAFRYRGRRVASLVNKHGDTLFYEEQLLALHVTARRVGLPSSLAVRLRLQSVLVQDAERGRADSLYWVLGVPSGEFHRAEEAFRTLAREFPSVWDRYGYSRGKAAQFMVLGKVVLVDDAIFPHVGRDKPGYKLAVELGARPGEPHARAMDRHLKEGLKATLLDKEEG